MTLGNIHVVWRGLLGNRLFQLAGGLVLAIESGARLRCLPITGFPLVEFSPPCPQPGTPETKLVEPCFPKEVFVEQLRNGLDVVVNGHHEQYRHYKDHKAAIRTILQFKGLPSYSPEPHDLVVHLRLTGANATETYDLQALREHIEAWRDNRIIVVTDCPSHPFIHEYLRKPYITVVRDTKEADFATLLKAKRIVLTPSTFGWWSGFLSYAEEIYFPFKQGVWKRPYIDLFVDDEPRYIKY